MKLNNIDLNLLKVFITVYQQQSLRKAGEKLFVSTPAVSQSIKKLKESLGEELFVLSGKQFVPTPFSDELYQKVLPLLEGISSAIETGKQFSPDRISESFHLEINPHVLPWITPRFFNLLHQQSPGSSFISHTTSQHSLQKLQQGTVDFVIHLDIENLPPDIIAVPLMTLEFVLAVRKDHPFTQSTVAIDELLDYSFAHIDLAYFESNRRSRLEEEMNKLGKPINMVLRTTSLVGLIETVKQTDLIAPCLSPIVEQYKDDLRSIHVEGLEGIEAVEVYAYLHKKNQHSSKYKWLLELIKTSMAN